MFQVNNILLFLFTVIPSILYLWTFYSAIPSNKVSLRKALNVFFVGFFSVTLVKFVHFIFPHWSAAINPDDIIISVLFLAFVQVGLTEELCKFGTYRLSGVEKEPMSNLALMFYCAIPAISFAITENIMYITKYTMDYGISTPNSWSLSIGRNIHATTLHLTCCTIMGYFVVLGKQRLKQGKSWIVRFVNKNKRRRNWLYRIMGISLAAIVHGAYDLNFFAAKFIPGTSSKNVGEIATMFTVFGTMLMIYMVRKAVKMDKSDQTLSKRIN